MATVSAPPTGAKPPVQVDLTDPATRAAWAAAMHESAADAIAAAEDQTRPSGLRDLGRREARRIIRDAKRSIASLLASIGFVKDAASGASPAPEARAAADEHESTSGEDEGNDEIAALGQSALAFACAHTAADQEDALEDMPLAGVLFLAVMGSPGERAEVDPPLLLALRSLRATVHAWEFASSRSTIFSGVSFADLDLLGRRLDATIEIAKRGGMGGAP